MTFKEITAALSRKLGVEIAVEDGNAGDAGNLSGFRV